jgi:hypothetical protein
VTGALFYSIHFILMSELGHDEPSKLDSSYPFDLFCLDYTEPNVLSEEWPFAEKQLKSTSSRPRIQYGHGLDARRTAKYRCYPISESPVMRSLLQHPDAVTRQGMMTLIDSCLATCPPDRRPNPPTRSQKRVKGGLVSWMDENASFVMHYIRWAPCLK